MPTTHHHLGPTGTPALSGWLLPYVLPARVMRPKRFRAGFCLALLALVLQLITWASVSQHQLVSVANPAYGVQLICTPTGMVQLSSSETVPDSFHLLRADCPLCASAQGTFLTHLVFPHTPDIPAPAFSIGRETHLVQPLPPYFSPPPRAPPSELLS